ncbi:hypothetical protein [Paenibacillus etheri]|uniref:hypothetical protein n=1 Tax=Paenibacillus etheri TaxID=1306852 RepID=UPI000ADE8B74|nr:hypothetical protein [Paenibacillus etheri]
MVRLTGVTLAEAKRRDSDLLSKSTREVGLLGGAVVVEADGLRVDQEGWSGGLYSRGESPPTS